MVVVESVDRTVERVFEDRYRGPIISFQELELELAKYNTHQSMWVPEALKTK